MSGWLLDAPVSAIERATIELAQAREASGSKSALRAHGVVHTPLPLVRLALQRVHEALTTRLGVLGGLSSERVAALDPAAGTGVWLASLLTLTQGGGGPAMLLGFDTDAEALEATRTLLTPELQGREVPLLLHNENTLALADPWPDPSAVRVIVGNPPWGARSLSRGLTLSDRWLREFHHDAQGQPLDERRTGVLSDDYVRFFRWALQQAREAQHGAVVCFVTNASYLEGPVHRGMRAALVGAFDELTLLDLGGNALLSQGSEPDQSLFPVRVGAVLTLCVRRPGQHARHATASYARLHGTRASKLGALREPIEHTTFTPSPPLFRLRPARSATTASAGFSLADAFPFHAEGVQTNRDALATASTREQLIEQLAAIQRGQITLAQTRHFDLEHARRCIAEALREPERNLLPLAYRPFEERVCCMLAPLCHRPRPLLQRAVRASTLSLVSVRKEPGGARWNMFAAVSAIADSSFLSTRSSCRTRLFPSHDPEGAENLAPELGARIAERLGRMPSSLELIHYTLGLLGSPRYRSEHQQALKHDYPHLPWPMDAGSFARTCAAGQQFVTILAGGERTPLELQLDTQLDPLTRVSHKTLRWLAPNQLELAPGTRISAGNERSLGAQVGHHAIVESVYRSTGGATIRTVLDACQRALMWGEAEKAADSAYQPATSVRPHATGIAVID